MPVCSGTNGGALRFVPALRTSPVCSSRYSLPSKALVAVALAEEGVLEEAEGVICGWT